ncbi:MAG: lamin tail domain-containing protein [Chloroflexota bacterium]
MKNKYRVLVALAGFAALFLFITSTMTTWVVYSGGTTPEALNYLPLIIAPEGTPTVTPTATPTAAPTVIPPGSVPNVVIDQIVYDPSSGNDLDGEYVRILNNEAGPVDLTDWRLSDEANTVFVFPEFVLEAGTTVRVWVKEGSNNDSNLYWGRNRSVWNNAGDTAELKNSNSVLVDLCSYPGGGNSSNCN